MRQGRLGNPSAIFQTRSRCEPNSSKMLLREAIDSGVSGSSIVYFSLRRAG
jgi:hypothetical protein